MMLLRRIILVVSAAATSAAVGNRPPAPFVLENHAGLSVRGGGITIDKPLVAKSAAAVMGAYGGFVTMAPLKIAEAYGMKDSWNNHPALAFLGRRAGMAELTTSILWLCLAERGMSLNAAVGIGLVPWLLLSIGALLDEKPKKLGYPGGSEITACAMFAFGAHATLANMPYAAVVIKAVALWGLLGGVSLFINPMAFGIEGMQRDDMEYFSTRNMGYALCFLNSMQCCLAFGVDINRAMGYSWLVLSLGLMILMFGSKDFEKHNIAMGPCWCWLVFSSLVSAALLC